MIEIDCLKYTVTKVVQSNYAHTEREKEPRGWEMGFRAQTAVIVADAMPGCECVPTEFVQLVRFALQDDKRQQQQFLQFEITNRYNCPVYWLYCTPSTRLRDYELEERERNRITVRELS